MGIRLRQGRPRGRRQSQMRQLALAACEAAADLAQRVRSPQLTEPHRDELAPTREPACVPLRLSRHDSLLKLRARKELEYLTEDAAESGHRGRPPSDAVNCGKSATSYVGASGPFVIYETLIWTRALSGILCGEDGANRTVAEFDAAGPSEETAARICYSPEQVPLRLRTSARHLPRAHAH